MSTKQNNDIIFTPRAYNMENDHSPLPVNIASYEDPGVE